MDVRTDGSAFINGQKVSLTTALRVFASRHSFAVVRGAEEFQAAQPSKESKIKSKADFRNNAEKRAFVREHGSAAFIALPLVAATDPEKMPTRDILRLPTREKVRLVNLYGEVGYAKLLERNKNL
jgi:hypothetical protein